MELMDYAFALLWDVTNDMHTMLHRYVPFA